MKILFGILFLSLSVAASAQSKLDSLFSGKTKIDSAKYNIKPAPKKDSATLAKEKADSVFNASIGTGTGTGTTITAASVAAGEIKPAVFPSGDKGWKKFIDNAVNYVTIAASEQKVKKGHYDITLTYVIQPDGTIGDIEVRVSPNVKYFETAFIERLKRSPKWTPATQGGQNVKFTREQEVTVVIN